MVVAGLALDLRIWHAWARGNADGIGAMKVLWCWRCKVDVPMLDEEEFAEVDDLYSQALGRKKVWKIDHAHEPPEVIHALFQPVRDTYRRLTGFAEENHNAIMHHRISLYGRPCSQCEKPLRTPRTSYCAACGAARGPQT